MKLSNHRASRLPLWSIGAAALLLVGLDACSSEDDGDDDMNGSAGSMNMGSAGSAGSGMGSAGSGMGGETAMSFFVSSTSGPDGGNFGGLAGADEFCQDLAEAAGSTGLTWRALLSTDDVDARDRIGAGPWHNADSVEVAASVTALFSTGIAEDPANENAAEMDAKRLLLIDENGDTVSADPLQHDIVTGTNVDGTAAANNCANWTSNAATDLAAVGHSDSRGPQEDDDTGAWVNVHDSRGCAPASFVESGGNGRIYCFAEN